MAVKIVLLVILVLVCCYFLGLEVLRTGAGRRAGEDELRLLRRLRRRMKTFALLVLLYVLAAFYDTFATMGHFTARASLLYFGLAFTVLIWLLIIAARELREAALTAVEGSRQIRQQTMEELEKEIGKARQGRVGRKD